MQSLNATLRLRHHLENNQAFPSHEELLPHLQAEALEHRLSLDALDDDVAVGWRRLRAPASSQQIARPHQAQS